MSTLPANVQSMVAGLNKAVSKITVESVEGKQYLRLKKGLWLFGQEELEVEEDSKWAVNINSLASGFICWKSDGSGGEPLGEEMRSIFQDPVIESSLPHYEGGAWTPQVGFEMVCLNGDDKGTQCIFKASTRGAQNAFNTLLTDITKYLNANADGDKVVPVITLGTDSYQHKKKAYGTITVPVFKIVAWESQAATLDDFADDAPEEEPEEVVEEEKPVRRRRRA